MFSYIIDTETTGLKAGYNELTEISVIRCIDKKQKTWRIKIHHPERVFPQALAITGKTVYQITSEGKFLEEVVDQINSFIEEDNGSPDERIIVAHNAPFDRRMIEAAWKNLDKVFPANMWVCTMEMSRKFIKNKFGDKKPEVNLQALIKRFEIKAEINFHNASSDSRNTYRIRDFLIKNGMKEIEFVKKSDSLVKKATEIDEEAMKEVFDFSDIEE